MEPGGGERIGETIGSPAKTYVIVGLSVEDDFYQEGYESAVQVNSITAAKHTTHILLS